MTALKFKEGILLPFHDACSLLTPARLYKGAHRRRKFVLPPYCVQLLHNLSPSSYPTAIDILGTQRQELVIAALFYP